jgi:hypothetical protein
MSLKLKVCTAGDDSPARRLLAMAVRYPVHRLVQKLQALAWSEIPGRDHALAHLEDQVDLLLHLGPEHRNDPAPAPTPAMNNRWPGEF